MQDYEGRGSFYLGREYDIASAKILDEKILYDSSDLTTHAVCVGMTGSGKTGLCLSLIEEAALDGIPVIAVDPKGDLGNLLLAFPDLAPQNFAPWIDPAVAVQKGQTPEEFAEKTAQLWRDGLAKWDEDPERIQRFNNAVDKVIYTPGSSAGIPLTVLKGFTAPPTAVLEDSDALRDRIQSTTQGVLALIGVNADPVKSREAIFISNILDHCWRSGKSLDLAGLIHDLQQPPFKKVGIVDVEMFFPAADRLELGMKLNNLLASPSFASWLDGDALDVQKLFYNAEGKPRLSILSIAHLNDAERMFFVTILLNEVLSWMRSQPGTGSLRAILYMDEVFGYFPPTANPPSKLPMLTLLKQARAFGLGVVLATQNPVDLDYKGLSNAGTWFLGRLQTERDKLRVMEGLEGASAQAGSQFDRNTMEKILAGLGNRVFLMNNVHENQPQVFHTRWAMSYLRGPLTRDQIRKLMEPRRAEFAATVDTTTPETAATTTPGTTRQSTAEARPVLSGNIPQRFWPLAEQVAEDAEIEYRPGIASRVRLHFVNSSAEVDQWRESIALQTAYQGLPHPVWDSAMLLDNVRPLEEEPFATAVFAPLASELAQEKNYGRWDNELKEYLYREEKLNLWKCDALAMVSRIDEAEVDFRARLAESARAKLDEMLEAEKERFKRRIERAEEAVRKAEDYAQEQKSQFWVRLGEMLLVVLDVVLGIFGKGRRSRRQPTTAVQRTMRERGEHTRAEQRLEDKRQDLQDLEDELSENLSRIEDDFDPTRISLEKLEIPPRKSDIDVGVVQLVWLPWRVEQGGNTHPAW